MRQPRRRMLQSAAALVAGVAAPKGAHAQTNMPFTVAQTVIPIAGSGAQFPERWKRSALPRRPILFHRRKLGAARREKGIGPEPRAAVLLPEADRCGAA